MDNLKNSNYFYYNEDQNITTLDPAFVKSQSEIWAVSQLFEGLLEFDDSLHIKPCLADSWHISPDGRLYTFFLRRNVFFHPVGPFKEKPRQMKASDVVYSFRRIANPVTASPGAWIFNDKLDLRCFSAPDSFKFPVVALDNYTVQITLMEPFSPFAGILAMPYCFVLPEEAVGESFRNNPVGTGPFMFRQWEEDVNLLFARNPLYYRYAGGVQLPYLDGILIDNVKNKQTAFMKFIQGEYDFFNGIDASIKDELLSRSGELRDKYKGRFAIQKSPFLNTEYVGFNIGDQFKGKPQASLNFRKALNFAIDRKKLIAFLRNGIGTPATNGFVPVGLPEYPYGQLLATAYHPDSAKHYLQMSGIQTVVMEPLVINTTQDYLELMIFVQKEWSKLGIPVKIEVHPSSFLRQLRKDQKIGCWRGSWIADYPDPENFLVCFETRNFSPSGPNYFHFSNSKYDLLMQESMLKTNHQERMGMLAEAERIMQQEVPCVVLYYDQIVRLSQNHIKGLGCNPLNGLKLREIQKHKKH